MNLTAYDIGDQIALIKPLLKTAIETISGLQVYWEEQDQPHTDPERLAIVELSPLPPVIRFSEVDASYDVEEDELREQIAGTYLWTVRAKVYSERSAFGFDAMTYAQRIQHRTRRSGLWASLVALGLSFSRAQNPQNLGAVLDQNWESIAVIELRFNLQSLETQQVLGYIDRVKVDGVTVEIPPEDP